MAEKYIAANADDADYPPSKRIKVDNDNENEVSNDDASNNDGENDASNNDSENDGGVATRVTESDLSGFTVKRVLQNNCARKMICVEGSFKDRAESAIVLLEQKSFPSDESLLKKGFFDRKTIYRKVYANDVYGNYDCFPSEEYNSTYA